MSLEKENMDIEAHTKIENGETKVETRNSKAIIGNTPTYDMLGFASPRDYLDEFKGDRQGFSMHPISAIFFAIHIHGYIYILIRSMEKFFFAIIPTIALLPFMIWYYKNKFHCPIYDVISCYADGIGALGMTSIILKIFYITYKALGFRKLMLTGNIHAYTLHAFTHVIISEIAKCYAYARNGTHKRVKKAKRAMIVSLIIALGFTFGESLHLVNVYFLRSRNEPTTQDVIAFMVTTIMIGQPLHILCGYLSGLLNTINTESPFRPCLYTIPARGLYLVFVSRIILNRSFENFVVGIVGGSSAIMFLLYFTRKYANNMPEIATKSYLSVLDYDEEEEEIVEKSVENLFVIGESEEEKNNILITPN